MIGLGYDQAANTGIEWPPYSPDLNPCDFFLWGYLKDRVYREAPRTISDLRTSIEQEIKAIGKELLEQVIGVVRTR